MPPPIAYFAIVELGGDGSTSAYFPDVPGCAAAADPGEDIVAEAIEALNAHLELTDAQKQARPDARDAGALRADADVAETLAEGGFLARVPVLVAAGGKPRRVNVSFTDETLRMIDSAAALRGLNRSAFLAEAVRESVELHAS